MKFIYTLAAAMLLLSLGSCSKDSGEPKKKIEHTVRVQFVDADGNSIINGQNHIDAVKIVTFDSDGVQHDFFNPDWFGMNGFTMDPYNKYIFTIYLTLPDDGNTVTETYMLFFGEGPDVFTAEYEVREGRNEEEPYGGGTVMVQRVKLNGELIWDRKDPPAGPYKIFKELPVEGDE